MKLIGTIGLVAMLIPAAVALAAGPFDGKYTGESPPAGGKNACPSNTITATVTDNKLAGSYQVGQYNFKLSGTVAADGTVNGSMGGNPLTGKFTGSDFKGFYPSKECKGDRQVTLHKAG